MKNFKYRFLNIILALTMCLTSFVCLASAICASQTGFVLADNIESQNLIYNPTALCADENYVYVFDSYLNKIKVYDAQTTQLRDTASVLDYEKDVLQMEVCDNLLFVLSASPSTIEVFDTSTLTLVDYRSFDTSQSDKQLTILNNAKNLTVCPIDENNIMIIFSVNDSGEEAIRFISLTKNASVWEFSASLATIAYEHGLTLPQEAIINSIRAFKAISGDFINLVFSTDSQVYSIIAELTQQTSYTLTTLDVEVPENKVINGLARFELAGGSYLAVLNSANANNALIYAENTASGYSLNGLSLTASIESQNCAVCSVNDKLFIANSTSQVIKCYTLGGAPLAITQNEFLKNAELNSTALAPSDFVYFKTTKSTKFYASPYSTSEMFNLTQNTHLCQIQTTMRGEEDLENFTPCLYTTGGKNYYGFVPSSDILELNNTEFDKDTVQVFANTKLFKLPSVCVSTDAEEKNEILKTFNQATELQVVVNELHNTLNDNYNSDGRKFVMVRTDENVVGFVETTQLMDTDRPRRLVVCNASTKREVIVYLDKNATTIIDTISEGHRVKIADDKKTNSKYVKVIYNNDSGEEVTGYVLASALNRDSWSILQIIGLAFIVLNMIFLFVLLGVKKRINHD